MTHARFGAAWMSGLGAVLTLSIACAQHDPETVASSEPLPDNRPAQVTEVSPSGVQRGVDTELVLSGTAVRSNPRLLAPFKFVEAVEASNGVDGTIFKTRITVDPATPLGIYPVRVRTDEGLSEPFPLAVGQLPVVRESRGQYTRDSAPLIPTPCVYEGRLSSNDERDFFRFRGKQGQRIVLEPQFARIGSRFDPDVTLDTNAADFRRNAGCAYCYPADRPLFAELPRTDDYVVTVYHQFFHIKSGRPDYRLVLGAIPATNQIYPLGGRRGETVRVAIQGGTLGESMVVPVTLDPAPGESIVRIRATTAEVGPNGTPLDVETLPPLIVDELRELLEPDEPGAPPLKAAPPVVFNGRIAPPDEDRFILDVSPGQTLRVEVAANDLDSWLRAELKVQDSRGKVIAASTGGTVPARGPVPNHVSFDPSTEFTVPDGQTEVTLLISGSLTVGPDDLPYVSRSGAPYRVRVTPVAPGFDLELNDAQVNVPRGGTAAVGVAVIRKGFSGPITLTMPNAPPGMVVRPGKVAAGQNIGWFTVAAGAEAKFEPTFVDVVGEGHAAGKSILARASKIVVFGRQTTLPGIQHNESNVRTDVPAYLRSRISTQPALFAALAAQLPLTLDAPAGPVKVVRGQRATLKVKVSRTKGADGTLKLRSFPLPSGLSVSTSTVGETATEASVTVLPAAEHPLGDVSIVLAAQGRIAGKERLFVAPTVTLRVVPAADFRSIDHGTTSNR